MNVSSDQISVLRYLDPMRRFAPLLLVGTLVGAVLGLAAHALTGSTWISTASVLVSPISSDPVDGLGTSVVEVDMATEAEVATSLLVAERANDLLAGQPPAKDPRDLLDQVDTSVRGTRIIEMRFTAGDPDSARRGAEAFATAFLSYRAELATSQLEVSSGRVAERIAQLQLELTDLSTQRAEVPESERDGAAYAALVINEQTLLDELSINQGRLADLRAVITDDAVVLDAASVPRAPSSLGWTTMIAGGAAAGFVVAAGAALVLDAARRRGEDDAFAEAGAVDRALAVEPAESAQRQTPAAATTEIDEAVERWTAPASAAAEAPPTWGDPTANAGAGSDGQGGDEPPETARDAGRHPEPSDAIPAAPSAMFITDTAGDDDGHLDDGAHGPLDAIAAGPEAFGTASVAATGTAMPDPFAIGGDADDVWRGSDAAADPWAPAAVAAEESTDDVIADADPWGAPLSESDETTWAGIVEAEGVPDAPADTAAGEMPAGWNAPDTQGDDPWAASSSRPWESEASPPGDVASEVADGATPVDLDGLLHERARESVAQLGDHLTQAVDAERRAVLVVDGGDGAAVPVAVAMAAHLAAGGRRTLLVDPRGDALVSTATGRHEVRDHPALEVLVGDTTSDHARLVADSIADGTLVVFAGAAVDSPLIAAGGDWPGAIVIATTGVANPASIPGDAFERVTGSPHPLIGIVSIMARPAMAPPSH